MQVLKFDGQMINGCEFLKTFPGAFFVFVVKLFNSLNVY